MDDLGEDDGSAGYRATPGSTRTEDPIEIDDDEDLKKPTLNLRYAGFTLPDVCLVIIAEPFDGSYRANTREPSTAPGVGSRFVGLAPRPRDETEPPQAAPNVQKKPLFRGFTPFTEPDEEIEQLPTRKAYPPVPLFHEDTPAPGGEGEDSDGAGASHLLQFSQAMNVGGSRAHTALGAEDDDEDDVDAFLADADEAR